MTYKLYYIHSWSLATYIREDYPPPHTHTHKCHHLDLTKQILKPFHWFGGLSLGNVMLLCAWKMWSADCLNILNDQVFPSAILLWCNCRDSSGLNCERVAQGQWGNPPVYLSSLHMSTKSILQSSWVSLSQDVGKSDFWSARSFFFFFKHFGVKELGEEQQMHFLCVKHWELVKLFKSSD